MIIFPTIMTSFVLMCIWGYAILALYWERLWYCLDFPWNLGLTTMASFRGSCHFSINSISHWVFYNVSWINILWMATLDTISMCSYCVFNLSHIALEVFNCLIVCIYQSLRWKIMFACVLKSFNFQAICKALFDVVHLI
jgi:hypothetical protein